MNKTLKLLAFFIIFLQLSGILPVLSTPNIPYNLGGSLAYAQDAKQAEKEEDDKLFFTNEKGEESLKGKVKLPRQNAGISPETFRMIEMIEKKNTELKVREEELAAKEQQLRTLEENIRKDLEKIEQALVKSKEQFGLKESIIKENVEALVKVYSSMKPAEAANLITAIDQDLALQIISGMKSKIAGQILSKLDVKVAKAISEKMAGKTENSNN